MENSDKALDVSGRSLDELQAEMRRLESELLAEVKPDNWSGPYPRRDTMQT
jgi:hypothetical protein